MNFWIALLIIAVAAMVITGLCVLLMCLGKRITPKRFDERQQQVRGKAANWALLTGIIYFCGIAIVSLFLPEQLKDYWFAVILAGLALEALVYDVYCVANDANIPLLGSPRQRILWGYLCGIIQLLAAAYHVGAGILYFNEAGQILKRAFHEIPLDAVAFSQLMCGFLLVFIATIELFRLPRRKEN